MHTSEQLRERLAHVPAPSLVGIGDNVLDCYLHEDLAYPGGNALNVAAYSRLFFAGTAGFIGIMGDDRFAAHLGGVLDEVGVDRSRVRVAHGANGMAFVALDDEGDRRFVGSNRGGVQHELRLRINEQDHEYIAGFARMHTSVYSSMNSELGAVAERGTLISYDYSDDARPADVTESAPHVEVAFFSGGALNDAGRDDLAAFALGQGARIVVVTRGAHGATAYERGARISAGVKGVAAVDALGAGDAFITGFLAARAAGSDIDECLDVAATTGALACTLRGAFGYPVEAGEDARRQLVKRHVTAATPGQS
ncbi:PfkB family carbohydrate kinase [Salana multivorans]